MHIIINGKRYYLKEKQTSESTQLHFYKRYYRCSKIMDWKIEGEYTNAKNETYHIKGFLTGMRQRTNKRLCLFQSFHGVCPLLLDLTRLSNAVVNGKYVQDILQVI